MNNQKDSNQELLNKKEKLKVLLAHQEKEKQELQEIIAMLRQRFSEICQNLELPEEFTKEILQEIDQLKHCAERDFIVSRGEYLNGKIMAKYLNYEFMDPKNLIFFDEMGNLDTKRTYETIEKELKGKDKVVVSGFYGQDPQGRIKTFQRGGSDITGSILAHGIDAQLYENWTDVSGIMTADPRKDIHAKPIDHMSYEELEKITQNGAQVYHKDAIQPAKDKNIPIQIKNTNCPGDKGTIIQDEEVVIQVGLLGCGTVGQGTYHILQENQEKFQRVLWESAGVKGTIEVKKILVQDIHKDRGIDKSLLTDKIEDILDDPAIDVVVELIGGNDLAREWMLKSFQNGKHVVTANKMALASAKGELEQVAKEKGCHYLFEAAVAGAIPVIRVINDSLQGNNIQEIKGIVNGTTNYILSQMTDEGTSYEEALKAAQHLGFAEMDPTSDVQGYDSAYKMSVLASLAFGKYPKEENISIQGITQITPADILEASQQGMVYKLIGEATIENKEIKVRVQPKMIPNNSGLAHVRGANNAISIYCDNAGEILLQGQGAGSRPTGSAVVSDIINISKLILKRKRRAYA